MLLWIFSSVTAMHCADGGHFKFVLCSYTYYYNLVLSCTVTYLGLRSMHGLNAIHTADPMSIHEVELWSKNLCLYSYGTSDMHLTSVHVFSQDLERGLLEYFIVDQ